MSEAPMLDGQQGSYEARSLWGKIELPCLLAVHIHEISHYQETAEGQSWLWTNEYVRTLSNIFALYLYGCGYTNCELGGCSAMFRSLNRISFRDLCIFELNDMWIDEENLARFLRSQRKNLHNLALKDYGLACGSWLAILTVVATMSELRYVFLRGLKENPRLSTVDIPVNPWTSIMLVDEDGVQESVWVLLVGFETVWRLHNTNRPRGSSRV
jgi:hypothetical protein